MIYGFLKNYLEGRPKEIGTIPHEENIRMGTFFLIKLNLNNIKI